ncbi:Facilitated trehalose transporter Tret1 [Chamberlinius hualienensis]
MPSKYLVNGKFRKHLNVLFLSAIASLAIASSGNVVSYPSTAVPDLNSNPNPYSVDRYEESWIGGLVPLGAVFGGAVGGFLMDYYGRKLTLMISALPYAIGWTAVVASQNIQTMYAGRFICGISIGMALGVAYVYIAEIAPAKIRGTLCALGESFYALGMIYVYGLGYFLSWQWQVVACLFVVLVSLFGIRYLPQTPRWLILCAQSDKAKFQKALEVLYWLRGSKFDIEAEIEEIQYSVNKRRTFAPWKDYIKKEHRKNIAICLSLFTVQQMCGNTNIKMYTVSICEDAGTETDENIDAIIVGTMAFVGCLFCILTVDFCGRRFLLILSTSFVALSMAMFGAFYKSKETDPDYAASNLQWIPLYSLMLNSFFYGTGIGPIPWMFLSELFPTDFRGKSVTVCVAWVELCSFVAAKFFVNIADVIGHSGGYWIFAGVSVIGCFICVFAAPETKRKTLEELQGEIFKMPLAVYEL